MRRQAKATTPSNVVHRNKAQQEDALGPMIEAVYAVADLRAEAECFGLSVPALCFAAIEASLKAKIVMAGRCV
jgi:hypothetical protein